MLSLPRQFARILLFLQGTADLLSTTQTRLATGKKVNSALDNPTNSSPPPASMPAPATSAICSTASATACRSCKRPNRHHLAAEAGRYRQVDRQPGVAATSGYSTKSNIQFTGTGAPSGPGIATSADITTSKLNGGFSRSQMPPAPPSPSRRYLAFGFQSRDQDGTGPVPSPIEPGVGDCGS